MFGYVYITTNIINNKFYIGQHRAERFDPEYKGSGVLFKKALKKYGKDNFETVMLCECFTEAELNEKEIYYIEKYNAVIDFNSYNIEYGGYHNGRRNLIAIYNAKLDHMTYIPKENLSCYEKLGYTTGTRSRSDESKLNYSKSKKGLIHVIKNGKVKLINADELEDYLQQGFTKGSNPTRPNQKLENRKWMHNNEKSIMVEPQDFEFYLNQGYVFGRNPFKTFERKAPAHNKNKTRVKINGKFTYISK